MKKKTRIKDQGESLDKLMELRREHPDYPIIPMVESEVVTDEATAYWMGRLGTSCIRKLFSGNKTVHEYDPDPDEMELYSTLDEAPLASGELEKAEEDSDYARELYNALPWQDCIVIYINTP